MSAYDYSISVASLEFFDHPAKKHCHHDEAEAHCIEVIERLGIPPTDKLAKAVKFHDYTSLVTRCFPMATLDQVKCCLDFSLFLWSFDDRVDTVEGEHYKKPEEQQKLVNKILQASKDETKWTDEYVNNVELDPHERYICHIMQYFSRICPNKSIVKEFISRIEEYLNNVILGSINWVLGGKETLEEYKKRRIYEGGVTTHFPLIELVYLQGESKEETEEIIEIENASNRVIAFVNDILSFYKEIVIAKSPNSYLKILMDQQGLTLEEATNHCLHQIEEDLKYVRKMLKEKERFHPNQRKYIEGLYNFTMELCYWQCLSNRYRHPQSPYVELRKYVEQFEC
ncbi:hypothetical protein ABK040_009616 [Willaertia magna]